MRCPSCDSASHKALYMGIPFRLCSRDACGTVWGWAAVLLEWVPFNGYVVIYTGSYLAALFRWLTDWSDNDDGDGYLSLSGVSA